MCRLLGYCPQTDPLLPLMTVLETLLFFGGLKGVGLEHPREGGEMRNCCRQKAWSRAGTALLGAGLLCTVCREHFGPDAMTAIVPSVAIQHLCIK